jgi:hypothetical protein
MRLYRLLAAVPVAAILTTPAPAVAAAPLPSGMFAYFANVNGSQDGTRRCAGLRYISQYYVALQPCANDSSQRWKLTLESNGMYIIQNAHTGTCMQPQSPATPGQQWAITLVSCAGGSSIDRWQALPYGGGFQFKNNHTGGYLDANNAFTGGVVYNSPPTQAGPGTLWALTSTP